jgi:hypothetical protein
MKEKSGIYGQHKLSVIYQPSSKKTFDWIENLTYAQC